VITLQHGRPWLLLSACSSLYVICQHRAYKMALARTGSRFAAGPQQVHPDRPAARLGPDAAACAAAVRYRHAHLTRLTPPAADAAAATAAVVPQLRPWPVSSRPLQLPGGSAPSMHARLPAAQGQGRRGRRSMQRAGRSHHQHTAHTWLRPPGTYLISRHSLVAVRRAKK
jgi:hypothetical protein